MLPTVQANQDNFFTVDLHMGATEENSQVCVLPRLQSDSLTSLLGLHSELHLEHECVAVGRGLGRKTTGAASCNWLGHPSSSGWYLFPMVYIEPPRPFTLGIHALVSTVLQRGVLVVVAGEPGDCRGIVDSLRERHQDTGFCAIKLSVYHLNKKSPQFTMGCTEVNLLSKHPLPQKVSRPHCDPGCSDTRSKITTKWSFHLVAAGASSFH